eukprot:CAMPEP_0172425742 /NCGR_PEP_ID=MMETSP1064-20121228/33812_1 /TAXON_ID=202472 /ORGANISM="Aulacoseira subarctica , Strain CCAP 1002/5" /LENGTH=501 /DNA_ID=CAMNT_0013168899 /DNA_START=139 /DNA_END=1644 /DNA_ORIENTATION=+
MTSPNSGDSMNEDPLQQNEEWEKSYPEVRTTAQLMATLWDAIVHATDMAKGESRTILFPSMTDQLSNPNYFQALLNHLDVCKDICDTFGITTLAIPAKKSGFTIKSYKTKNAYNAASASDDYQFTPDPYWDDDNFEPLYGAMYNQLDDEDKEKSEEDIQKDPKIILPEIENPIPSSDEELVCITQTWVSRMMSDMGICPFTQGSSMAGLPMGKVYYGVDRSTSCEEIYAAYWNEVVRLEQSNERDLSTTLLIVPEFAFYNVEAYENFCNTLTQPLETLNVEQVLQLVFFHPQWSFRDGGERSGTALAANYARRSPWPMINILRTKQVRTAQRGIPTGLVYQQNEKTLSEIGAMELERMLRLRSWEDLEDKKVNRRDFEALRVAQDFQRTGEVAASDISLQLDTTPAVNNINSKIQIEGGDMVKVIRQALERRLATEDGCFLSGAETSAAMIASDFLIQELDRIAASTSRSEEEVALPQMDDETAAIFGGGSMGSNVDKFAW